tara:strand:- start:280 stop:513 length:234 start_codon:yes stop_codon:yes gene_type:complete
MIKQENNKQTESSNELYTVLTVVLNVFLVSTINRLITVATKNETLNESQKNFIETEYGEITFIENGSSGFTKTVIHI